MAYGFDASLPIHERVRQLLSQLTLEEKIAQLGGTLFGRGEKNPTARLVDGSLQMGPEYEQASRHGLGGIAYLHRSLNVRQSVQYANALQKDIITRTRPGIPLLIFDECMHCLFAPESTVFPLPPALAASFDPECVQAAFDVIGKEARSRGVAMCFSPHCDLARDPRWGRMSETFGEDTFLAARMAAAAVKGLQGGDGLRNDHIAAAAKHFAGFGQSSGGRQLAPADIPPRQFLDEILPPFQAAVEAGCAGIMPAYTEIDGIPCHGNRRLLTDLLRSAWGFSGVTVSDFGAISKLCDRDRICRDQRDAAVLALLSGIDMDLPFGLSFNELAKQETLPAQVLQRIDEGVRRVLTVKMLLGLFDHPYVDEERAAALVNCREHRDAAVRMAQRSITLLKNENNVLPADPATVKRILVTGAFGDDRTGWRPDGDQARNITEALRDRLKDGAAVEYAFGCSVTNHDAVPGKLPRGCRKGPKVGMLPLSFDRKFIREAAAKARDADLVVACVGESSNLYGENFNKDRTTDRDDLGLPGNQLELLKALRKTGKPVVAVLFHGHTLAVGSFDSYADAILDCWHLGEGRGEAVAGTIFGEMNPAGRLPVTIAANAGQVPVHYARKGGFFDRDYSASPPETKYPFGFGLSYTSFAYENMTVTPATIRPGERVTVRLDITNTGDRAGDEVVQLYLSDLLASVVRPRILLKAFSRISLQPGEKKTVSFDLGPEAMEFTNEAMQRVVEPGAFEVHAGSNSRDLVLRAEFDVVDHHVAAE